MTRKEQLRKELERIVSVLSDEPTVRKIIVFGSFISGQTQPLSDLDVVVIQDTDMRFIKRLKTLRAIIEPRVGLDLLVYTPAELEELTRERPFVRDEVVGKGRVVYERDGQKVA